MGLVQEVAAEQHRAVRLAAAQQEGVQGSSDRGNKHAVLAAKHSTMGKVGEGQVAGIKCIH